MKKLFNKFLAGAITIAMVATLVIGVSATKSASADSELQLGKWIFTQGGHVPDNYDADAGYIKSVKVTDTGEEITDWERKQDRKQSHTAEGVSKGFTLDIEETGWDAIWDKKQFNPWSIITTMPEVPMEQAHVYQVKFKAKASKTKNVYVAFKTTVDGVEMPPYDQSPMKEGSSTQTNTIEVQEKEFTYTFTNYVGGKELTTDLMLGAFVYTVDYAGNDVSNIISSEQNWKGQVTVSDFSVTDLGVDPDVPTDPPAPTQTTTAEPTTVAPTTVAPTEAPTQETTKVAPAPLKLSKVKSVKVKSVKKKTIKVSWKKVSKAKSYQIKVGSKTYKANGTSRKIKNSKFKKGKKVTVKVRAVAGSVKGAWSKPVKKKLTK